MKRLADDRGKDINTSLVVQPTALSANELIRWIRRPDAVISCAVADVLTMPQCDLPMANGAPTSTGSILRSHSCADLFKGLHYFLLGRVPCLYAEIVATVVGIKRYSSRTIYSGEGLHEHALYWQVDGSRNSG